MRIDRVIHLWFFCCCFVFVESFFVFFVFFGSNSATDTVQQELNFVGQESGKLIAIRDIIRKVGVVYDVCVCVHVSSNLNHKNN